MTEAPPEGGNGSTPGEITPDAGGEFKPITSQDDLNRLIGDRVKRATSKFGDYDDLKTKAARLDEIEESNKTEIEKAKGNATKAETERDTAKAEALRLRVAVQNGISLEDADLFLTASDEETLTAQAKRLTEREAGRKKSGPSVPKEGTSTTSSPTGDDEMRDFTRDLFTRAVAD